jgi:hypothetical protein
MKYALERARPDVAGTHPWLLVGIGFVVGYLIACILVA